MFLNWREVPCDQQNGPIISYVVQYFATCGVDLEKNKTVVTIERNTDPAVISNNIGINGLTPNTEYAFQLAAVNTNGTGPFSEPIILGGK